jgi:hypothetical protein
MASAERTLRVFVSSASGALAPYRAAAVDLFQRLAEDDSSEA